MRKFIIDTDVGGDDAAALMMALREPDIEILGITTLGGNVPLENTTKNALQVIEECGKDVPVYVGCDKPLMRELVTADNVHGMDGMGDCGLIHPTRKPEKMHAVEFIIETVGKYPDEVEIISLGPATNIALAIMKDRETMKRVKHIWSMATSGFGAGNITPVAEFNVFVDAESYSVMLNSGTPMTIVGFDLCLGDAAITPEELNEMSATSLGRFIAEGNRVKLAFNEKLTGTPFVDLPDAVAMAVALYPEVVTESITAHCYCCIKETATYGQVIIYDVAKPFSVKYDIPETNSTVIKSIDTALFKQHLLKALDIE